VWAIKAWALIKSTPAAARNKSNIRIAHSNFGSLKSLDSHHSLSHRVCIYFTNKRALLTCASAKWRESWNNLIQQQGRRECQRAAWVLTWLTALSWWITFCVLAFCVCSHTFQHSAHSGGTPNRRFNNILNAAQTTNNAPPTRAEWLSAHCTFSYWHTYFLRITLCQLVSWEMWRSQQKIQWVTCK
jgi:hypothetical protein